MPTATATLLPADQPHALYHRYDGQVDEQPCHLTIDLDDGEVSCDWKAEIGRGCPASVYHSRVLWVPIPTLATPFANRLITEAIPYAQQILSDSTIEWNGNNHVGRLGEAATLAVEELEAHIARSYPNDDSTGMVLEEMYAGSWFTDPEQDAQTLSMTADTRDDDLPAVATRFEKLLRDDIEPNQVITGALEAVTQFRDELRTAARAELATVAAELAWLTNRRDQLIGSLHSWGDSLRAIGALADLSHTQVDRIAQATSVPAVQPTGTMGTGTMGTGNVADNDKESLVFADESDYMDDESAADIHPEPCGYPDVIPCICTQAQPGDDGADANA